MTYARSRPSPLNVRWTIGDVRDAGFEALRLSIRGLCALLGEQPRYIVYVNTLSVEDARRRTGPVSARIEWRVAPQHPPSILAPHLDAGLCEGTAWKLMPLQINAATRELALDNDVILWRLPDALREWLADPNSFVGLLAADVTFAHGRFTAIAGDRPLNTGIRGTPAGYDFADALAATLAEVAGPLRSELDEQGLQIATLRRTTSVRVVSTADVAICSPIPPHSREPGHAGAHFVGLNTPHLPWTFEGRPAAEVRLRHWQDLAPLIRRRIAEAEADAPCI